VDELKSLPKAHAATGTAPSPPPGATTVDRSFLKTSFNDAQRFWDQQFREAGLRYSQARLVIFSSHVRSGCGLKEDVGPFYCPADRTIYLDLTFFELLAQRAGLGGFAQAYVIGHEFGHHIQHLLGVHQRVAAANQANPAGENTFARALAHVIQPVSIR
jgi:predicted metalloprotease